MRLGIVIPLKARSASRSWDAKLPAFHRTLCSVKQLPDTSLKAIVAGHDRPHFMDDSQSQIAFTATTNPAPSLIKASEFQEPTNATQLTKTQKFCWVCNLSLIMGFPTGKP